MKIALNTHYVRPKFNCGSLSFSSKTQTQSDKDDVEKLYLCLQEISKSVDPTDDKQVKKAANILYTTIDSEVNPKEETHGKNRAAGVLRVVRKLADKNCSDYLSADKSAKSFGSSDAVLLETRAMAKRIVKEYYFCKY